MEQEKTRQEEIHEKGFALYDKIKIGSKTLEDATLELGTFKCLNSKYTDKATALRIIEANNIEEARKLSQFFYNISGIYERVCKYAAKLYRFDWYIQSIVYNKTNENVIKKLEKDFQFILDYFDNSYIKKISEDIAEEVVINGVYYGYWIDCGDSFVIQQLPTGYCRSRFNSGNLPAVEFDMSYFDTFSDRDYRARILKMFPKEFSIGYKLYQEKKLPSDDGVSKSGKYYLLDTDYAVKFSLSKNDFPMFVNAIPSIIDLDAAQELDRKRQMQKLSKIFIQLLPRDKNGDLLFDNDEAFQLHKNASAMLKQVFGAQVFTTFADIETVDMSEKATSAGVDDLEKRERTVYNNFGVPQNIFNSSGNLSVEKSVLNDEASLRNLLLQFQIFYDRISKKKSKTPKNYLFRFYFLETTQYNYKDLAKTYKDHAQLGFSKFLPQIALGHSQNSIYNSAYFENDVLELSTHMVPLLTSNTINSEDVKSLSDGDGEVGRPELDDGEKSDKTLQNLESES